MSVTINMKGRFKFKPPFITKPNLTYEVTAIRELVDMYNYGIDVYNHVYKPAGLINGVNVNGTVFNYDEEIKKDPVIISLVASDDTLIYVPDNYILEYPTISDIQYSRIILSADLGALPDYVDLTVLRKDVEDLIVTRMGTKTKVAIHKAPDKAQPTQEEHELLEKTRAGAIKSVENYYSKLKQAEQKIISMQKTIDTMQSILIERNLI